jgi:hypothetical protein
MEWVIIILLIIFVIMFYTLKPLGPIQTQLVDCYQSNNSTSSNAGLVMLPKLNPTQLTTHITV